MTSSFIFLLSSNLEIKFSYLFPGKGEVHRKNKALHRRMTLAVKPVLLNQEGGDMGIYVYM